MQTKRKWDVRTLALVGVLSAMVFALSWVKIQIGDISRLHLGNVMCLISGVLFGPFVGGLSAGFGSMLYDFTDPLYISEFWITFLTKFAMGYMAGLLSKHWRERLPFAVGDFVPALGGSLTYVVLYVLKSIVWQHFVYGNPWNAVWPVVAGKAGISAINGIIAVAACTVLAPMLRAALRRANFLPPRRAG